jgi:rhamnulose-1-phosphate aldolase
MYKEHNSLFSEIKQVAGYLWERGWAEKNAGNFSVRLSAKAVASKEQMYPLEQEFPTLANQVFLISIKGSRMRNMAKNPKRNTLFIQIGPKGQNYQVIHRNKNAQQAEPTSELSAHLSIHNMLVNSVSTARVVMHTHVTELIALTHIPQFCNETALNNLLWGMHPETVMFVPGGVGFVPFELPGSAAIAELTTQKLTSHQVAIWEKHGAFSVASSVQDCFDTLDILAKSARIYFMVRNSLEKEARPGLTKEQLEQLRNIDF